MTDDQANKINAASAFGNVYARLDMIRTLSREAALVAGPFLEAKHIEVIELIEKYSNIAIGNVMDASKRSANG